MLLLLTLATLSPCQTDLPLSFPEEDDGIIRTVFTATGSSLLVAHGPTGSVSRIDVGQGVAVERLGLGDGLLDLKLSDAGTEAFALEGPTARLHKLQPSPLAECSDCSSQATWRLRPPLSTVAAAPSSNTSTAVAVTFR